MNITYLLPIIIAVVYLMIFMSSNKILTACIVKRNIKRKRGLNQNMNELLQSFVEKDCIIYCVNNTSVDGIIKDVKENAVLIETRDGLQLINTDFITRVREYPKGKNGKRKGFLMD